MGSPLSSFDFDLSCYYGRMAFKAGYDKLNGYKYELAIIHQGGEWSFPEDINVITKAQRYPITKVIEFIKQMCPTLVLSHLFCNKTGDYLSLFELLDLPVIGPSAKVLHLVADKGSSRGLMELFQLPIPKGLLLDETTDLDDIVESLDFPCVVKPTTTENSLGISLVHTRQELLPAVNLAFDHSPQVLIEKFIAGREVRVGVIEDSEGQLLPLPPIEYKVDPDSIRTFEDKLQVGEKEKLQHSSATVTAFLCPKKEKKLVEELHRVAIRNHTALGCRDFSSLDCRVSDVDGSVQILECNVFCTFSPKSVINLMWKRLGGSDAELLDLMVQRTKKRSQATSCDPEQ